MLNEVSIMLVKYLYCENRSRLLLHNVRVNVNLSILEMNEAYE